MKKAVTLSIGMLILLACAAQLRAQTNDTDFAVRKSVWDQANTFVLREKLADAKAAAARGDLTGAAKIYEDAFDLASQIGSINIEAETAQTVAGLTTVRMALARQYQSLGDLQHAEEQVSRVLKVDPKNADAIAFKTQNDQMKEAMKGQRPDDQTISQIPIVAAAKIQAGTLVQDGKLLYEMGKLEDAEAKLAEALKLDPENSGAFYYYQLIRQARYDREVHKQTTAEQEMLVRVETAFNAVTRII